MVAITDQKALREVRDLPFCYVCGRSFSRDDQTNHDHVPAEACFDKTDRNPPLKLKTHVSCNHDHKLNDEKLGQLIAAQRRKAIDPEKSKLDIKVLGAPDEEPQLAYFDNLDLIGAIRRWVCGFHAALYREPLPLGPRFQVTPPLPYGRVEGNAIRAEPVLDQHLGFVGALKSNREFGRIDSVVTCSGKMRYECVWGELDDGKGMLCIFGLDIYGWIGLGDSKNFGARGCTGGYMLDSGSAPADASIATRLILPFRNRSPFDPFGP